MSTARTWRRRRNQKSISTKQGSSTKNRWYHRFCYGNTMNRVLFLWNIIWGPTKFIHPKGKSKATKMGIIWKTASKYWTNVNVNVEICFICNVIFKAILEQKNFLKNDQLLPIWEQINNLIIICQYYLFVQVRVGDVWSSTGVTISWLWDFPLR